MSFFENKFEIEISTASGVESITKRELLNLGYDPSGAVGGRILIEGTMVDVMRCNIFLRTASRVRIVLARAEVLTFDQLFDCIESIAWQDILPNSAKIVVNAKSLKSELFALSSVQSITKKAIINKLQNVYKTTKFSEDGDTYDIEVNLTCNTATVTLDSSGSSLHKRGYRTYLGDAPMKETLASAIVNLSVWNRDRTLVDPFCGSGTILIESALSGLNIAPNMNRNFAVENFDFAPSVRNIVQEEAEQVIIRDKRLKISGFDINPKAIKLAQKHAEKAGVAEHIHLQTMDMRSLSSKQKYGVIVTNPPYGERLMRESELRDLYRDFGKVFKSLDEWSLYLITSYKGFEKYFGKRAGKTRKLYNSELEGILYQYLGAKPPYKKFDN